MRFGRTLKRLFSLAGLVLGLCSCERGCLARSLGQREPGASGPEGTGGAAPRSSDQGLDLTGTDCSDGLLRCVDGTVEGSRRAHLPHPCRPGQAAVEGAVGKGVCVCPWDVVARCPSGCAVDGLEVLGAPSDAGAAQLCRPDEPVARPILPGDPGANEICASEGLACIAGVVRSCEAPGRPSRAVAYCLNGCQPHVGIDDWVAGSASLEGVAGTSKHPDGVVSILCRRDHAERR